MFYCSVQPDCQWYVPDQFPPDVQHKANGKTTAVLFFKMGAFEGYIVNFPTYLLSAYMTALLQQGEIGVRATQVKFLM